MSSMSRRLPLLAACAAGAAVASDGTLAVGTGPNQVSFLGGGTASALDSTWQLTDPAALVGGRTRFDVGAEAARARDTLEPKGALANPTAGELKDTGDVVLPYVTASGKLGDGTLMAGFAVIGGLTIDFDHARSIIGALNGDVDRRAALRYERADVGYGRSIDGWDIAIVADGDYASFRSDGVTRGLAPTTGDDETDSAWGGGFQVAVHRRFDAVDADVAYTSRQWLQRFDTYDDLLPGPADIPQIVRAGVAWQATTWLQPVLDYRWIDWRSVKTYGDRDVGLGWKSQHIGAIGVNLTPHRMVTIHAGVDTGTAAIDKTNLFLNGVSPLLATTHAALGATWRPDRHLEISAAVMHAFKRTVTDDGSDLSGAGRGTKASFELTSIVGGIGYTF